MRWYRRLGWGLTAVFLLAACQGESGETAVTEATQPSLAATEALPTVTTGPLPTTAAATAADADVTFVRATQTGPETWTFAVTVAHPDTGWEDYADGWDVVLPDESVVKPDADAPFTRLLLHPHETEQPFTRSQSGIVIPASVTSVRVRAHDLVDGFGGQEVVVDLTVDSGPDFKVNRQ